MPKRSERDLFDNASFERNPFEGMSAEKVYRKLRWGNTPRQSFSVNAPEELAAMGVLQLLVFDDGERLKWPDPDSKRGLANPPPYLAIGVRTNFVYIVPRKNGRPVNVPKGPYSYVGHLKQTDYTSDKGGEEAYFYHKHEKPYPALYQHKRSGVMILMPAEHKGRRSYAVVPEGIVG